MWTQESTLEWSIWKAFLVSSNAWMWTQEPTLEWHTWKVVQLGQPYSQTLEWLETLVKNKHCSLLQTFVNEGHWKFYNNSYRCQSLFRNSFLSLISWSVCLSGDRFWPSLIYSSENRAYSSGALYKSRAPSLKPTLYLPSLIQKTSSWHAISFGSLVLLELPTSATDWLPNIKY